MDRITPMPGPGSADSVKLIDGQFCHFEQLREAALAWDLDFRQLARGRANHQLFQASTDSFELIKTVFNVPYDQRSASHPHLRTFSILADEIPPASWCAQPFGSHALACFRPGGEFNSISSGYFTNFIFSLPETLLSQVAASRFLLDWSSLDKGIQGTIQQLKKPDILALRGCLSGLVAISRSPAHQATLGDRTAELAAILIRALASAKSLELSRGSRNRQRYFLRAREYIDNNVDNTLEMHKLCQHAGASERTLEYAFRENAFVTPKAYEIRQRIALAHRDLMHTSMGDKRVSEIANRWGFWHMGQFGRDYKKIFGEPPSTTLSRSLAS